MVEVLLAGAQDDGLRQIRLHVQAAQQPPQDRAVLVDQLLHAEPVLGVVAVAGALEAVRRVAPQHAAVIPAQPTHLNVAPRAAYLLVEFLHHAVVQRRKAAVARQRRVKVLRLHQPQVRQHRRIRAGQRRRGQVILIYLPGEAVAHLPVKADAEGQQQREKRAAAPGVVLKIPHHLQRRALPLVQRVYLQRHQAAGGLHHAEDVHGEQDELHGGDQHAALEKTHRPGLGVLPQLGEVLFPVVGAALLVQRLVGRVGVEIDVQIRLHIRLCQRADRPIAPVCLAFHIRRSFRVDICTHSNTVRREREEKPAARRREEGNNFQPLEVPPLRGIGANLCMLHNPYSAGLCDMMMFLGKPLLTSAVGFAKMCPSLLKRRRRPR